MKQIIERSNYGGIKYKYYENDKNQRHGLQIGYYMNGEIKYKTNYVNDNLYGLDINYFQNDNIEKIYYYL